MTKPLTTIHLLLALALAMLFSCSSLEFDNPLDPNCKGSKCNTSVSSSSGGSGTSSSSANDNLSSSSSKTPNSSSSEASSSSRDEVSSSSSGTPSSSSGDVSSSSSDTSSSSEVLKECLSHNPANHFCYKGKLYTTCNGTSYDLTTEICNGNLINSVICNGDKYNPLEHKCENSILSDRCGIGNVDYYYPNEYKWYNPETYFCHTDNEIYPRCSEEYNPLNQKCIDNIVNEQCGTNDYYNPATHFCHTDNVIYPRCSQEYDPETHFCNGGKLGKYCGNRKAALDKYDPDLYECGNGDKIYLKGGFKDSRDENTYEAVLIGTQTWMAKNLNYAYGSSRCYNDETDNCNNIYGRLYTWAAAKTVCPPGWHLPSHYEWQNLIDYVQNSSNCNSCSAKLLKSTSGWSNNNNGLDTYGFAAFQVGSSSGDWWVTNPNGLSAAYYVKMMNVYEYVSTWQSGSQADYHSVRCVKD